MSIYYGPKHARFNTSHTKERVEERRKHDIADLLISYCGVRCDNLRSFACTKAKESLEDFFLDITENTDKEGQSIANRISNSLYTQSIKLAIIDQDDAEALAQILIDFDYPRDLNLYPLTANDKLIHNARLGKAMSYENDELWVYEMFTFIRAQIEGRYPISPDTLKGIYSFLGQYLELKPIEVQIVSVLEASSKNKVSLMKFLPPSSVSVYLEPLIKKGIVECSNDSYYLTAEARDTIALLNRNLR